jgi:ArsR family transcriptional regulator, arsenate/arsenite/antimonite-responsive transcriptional repressor / arsenate reductase (thioredoxin)
MELSRHVEALSALAHPGRLAVFRLLMRRAPQAVRPTEIAEALGLKQNTLSVYLAILTRAGLATAEREGRAIHYRLDRRRIAGLIAYLAEDCCRGRPEICLPVERSVARKEPSRMPSQPCRILFICTGNSARSLMAESIVNADASGRFRAFSAGTDSRKGPNPMAMALLRSLGHDTSGLRSKDREEFMGPDAPGFDFVFTLCDDAANEECPAWPGQPITAHWGMPDPVKATGTEVERALAFRDAYRVLANRLRCFMALPIASLDRMSLQREIDAIAEMAGNEPEAC